MSSSEFGSFALALVLLIVTAQVLGLAFAKLRQPRVVGEILAGILLGPNVLGHVLPGISAMVFSPGTTAVGVKYAAVMGFLYHLGLLLLMFASGAETRGLFRREDRREVGWLGGVGTIMPFVIALALSPWLPRELMMGSANQSLPLLLVVGIAFSVTSIPVISRIFHDLGLSQTRFARLVLGVAVIEDILLWGVLAVATALAASDVLPREKIAMHVGAALLFFALGLTALPRLLRWANQWRGNVLKRNAPVAYVAIVLLTYTAAAAALDVSLVFAAFLAGYALISDPDVSQASEALNRVSFAVFIPIYFAVIGYQLDLSRSVPWTMAALFVVVASVVKLASAGIGARLAGFRWAASINLAMALNARGGPGIVLASVAFDAHIISAPFYTTLVLLAIVTSQMAGAWLDFVSRSERDLLGE